MPSIIKPRIYSLNLTSAQQQQFTDEQQLLEKLQTSYQHLHRYFISIGLSERATSALLLDIEVCRISHFFTATTSLNELAQRFSDNVTRLTQHPAKIWLALAPQAKARARQNKQFITKHLYLLGDQQYERLQLKLSLSERDFYLYEFKKQHAQFIPHIPHSDLKEIVIFELKHDRRAAYFLERKFMRQLAEHYTDFFKALHQTYENLSATDKTEFYCFKDRSLQQIILMALEVKRLRQKLNLADKKDERCPSLEDLHQELLIYCNYQKVQAHLTALENYLQTVCDDFNHGKKSIFSRENSRKHILEYYTKQAAELESAKLLGQISSRYVDHRIREAERIHHETVESYAEFMVSTHLLSPITSITSGAADGLRVYRSMRNVIGQFGPAGLPLLWLFSLILGVIKAIQTKEQSEQLIITLVRALEYDKGIGHLRLKNIIEHSTVAALAILTSLIFAYYAYLSISSVLVSITANAGPLTIALLLIPTTVAMMAYIIEASNLVNRFKVANDLAWKTANDRHGLARAVALFTSFLQLDHNSRWETILKVMTFFATIAITLAAIVFLSQNTALTFFAATASTAISTSYFMAVLLPGLINTAGYFGRWLDQHDIQLFELIGLGIDTFAKFITPMLVYQFVAASLVTSLAAPVVFVIALAAASVTSLIIPQLVLFHDKYITHRYGLDCNARLGGRLLDACVAKVRQEICRITSITVPKQNYVNAHLSLFSKLAVANPTAEELVARKTQFIDYSPLFFSPRTTSPLPVLPKISSSVSCAA